MSKLPSFQFYPGDWRKDQNLSRASKAAKGVFMDVLCLAFECENRGVFKTGKKPWTIEEIAYAVGGDITENIVCIRELLVLKVLRCSRNKTIFQHRIVKDENLRKIRTIAGSKGGNPILVNQTSKQKSTPSSSSSSSTSVNTERTEERHPLENSNLFRKPKVPTLEAVRETFMRQGGSTEMADKFFLKHEALGWYMGSSPIVNFVKLIPSFIHNWNKNIPELQEKTMKM